MDTAQRLRKLREARKLSQDAVAKMLDIDRTTYVKYESGSSIKRNLQKLADFFDVSTDYLLGRDPSNPTHENMIKEAEARLSEFNPVPRNDILTHDEQKHLKEYRSLTPEQRGAVDVLVEYFENRNKII